MNRVLQQCCYNKKHINMDIKYIIRDIKYRRICTAQRN
jgi:hypothetical protein